MFNEIKLEKRKKLIENGVNPYPYSFESTHTISELKKDEEKLLGTQASVYGRIVAKRGQGKIFFMNIEDFDSKIQIYIKKDEMPPEDFEVAKLIDTGDIIGVSGEVFHTKTGELTIKVAALQMLAKAVVDIPISKATDDKSFYQMNDTDTKYRERYTDWIIDRESRLRFAKRSKIIHTIRSIMHERGFIEVDTPTLELKYGGAEARPFETHVNALGDMKAFMRISPELYLKRYIVGGFPRVFTICQNFRNEGLDRSHNVEFTMMEWYEANTDYVQQMKNFENLVERVAIESCGSAKVVYQGTEIDFTAPWKRYTMKQAIKELGGLDADTLSDEEIKKLLLEKEVKPEGNPTRGQLIASLFEEYAEHKIVQPTFIIDHPKDISPLTKIKRGDNTLVERFEPFVMGMELGNAYSELSDPVDQYDRLEAQKRHQTVTEDGVVNHPMDLDFVKAIGSGMPPCGGVGIGIDRLIMFLTDSQAIRDVIAFPLMRPLSEE